MKPHAERIMQITRTDEWAMVGGLVMTALSRLSGFRGRGVTRGPRYNRQIGPPAQWRNDGYQNQLTRGTPRGRGIFRGSVRPPQLHNSCDRQLPEPYGLSCEKCGRWRHEHPNMYPAINQDCRGCGKKGHFLRVCRSIVRRDVMSD